ncbi:MAG: glutathione synthase [Armatimonadetes bacterium]|nr:glutathione synthase [Armatimonadota bacterium]
MRVGILITSYEAKYAHHTTIRLAREITNRGHEVWFLTPGDFAFDPDDTLWARARRAPRERYRTNDTYLAELTGEQAVQERIPARELDILLLRDNPARLTGGAYWAQAAGTTFGRVATAEGTVVLNDPDGLGRARNKMYFQLFPEQLRPRTLITRDRREVREFAADLHSDLILKPLQGSGGDRVFIVKKDENYNLNQLIDTMVKDGYVIAQEYLPQAEGGDIRIMLMNGNPLRYKGKYAAFRRVRKGDDIRSNMHAGGTVEKVDVDDTILALCEMVRPKLVEDGMFLVGLDVVGDKMMEVNVFCPGGLGGMEKLEGVNFSGAVVDALERKARYAHFYRRQFNNSEMATL